MFGFREIGPLLSQLRRHLGMSQKFGMGPPPRGNLHGGRHPSLGYSVKEKRTEPSPLRKGEMTYLSQVSSGAGD